MFDKATGYFMLLFGLAIISFAAYNVYTVFTKKTQPVQLFNFSGISFDTGGMSNIELPPELEKAGVKIEKSPDISQEIIPGDILNQTSNIFAHVIFMGFVSSVGFKIAQLGAIMVRPTKVELKQASIKQVATELQAQSKPPSAKPPQTSQKT